MKYMTFIFYYVGIIGFTIERISDWLFTFFTLPIHCVSIKYISFV